MRGKTALVIDDEVSTAGTLVQAAESLVQNGAQAVYAAFTHGVYVGPAIDRIDKAPIVEVAATNTCTYKARPSSKIKQLSVGPLFAEAIWRIHRGVGPSLFT